MRNPWGADYYTGPWSDTDSRWTTAYKAQVPYANKNEGTFFIDSATFLQAYYTVTINVDHDLDGWNHSYYEVLSDTSGATRSFTFTTTSTQELYVSADFYDYRMYPPGCKSYYTTGTLSVYSGSTLLQSASVNDQFGFGFIYFSNMAAGTYKITFSPSWGSVDVRDYTIQVYAPLATTIYDSNGKTSYTPVTTTTTTTTTTNTTTTNTTTKNTTTTTNTTTTNTTTTNTTTVTQSKINADLQSAISAISKGIYN